jgi:hypothetical protein
LSRTKPFPIFEALSVGVVLSTLGRTNPQLSYWMWIPEIARLMIRRWTSDVPSKIV